MTLKFFIPLVFLLNSIYCFAQEKTLEEKSFIDPERKGHLFLQAGPEYRITPLPYGAPINEGFQYTAIDDQNDGFAINYALDYFITQNLNVGFSHSFRYTYLFTDSYHPEDFGTIKANYGLMMDFHFYLDYHVKVFNNAELFARLGVSLMNRSAKYTYKKPFYDQNDEIIGYSLSPINSNYTSMNYALGYKKGKLELMVGIYTTNSTENFYTDERFTVPYLKLNFNLFKF